MRKGEKTVICYIRIGAVIIETWLLTVRAPVKGPYET